MYLVSLWLFLLGAPALSSRPRRPSDIEAKHPALLLSADQLSKCRLVTSDMDITPDRVVFATPSVIAVQDIPINHPDTFGASSFERFLAFRRPDGSCREVGSVRLHCEMATGSVDQHCKEYGTSVGESPCFAAPPGVCSYNGPAPWIQPEIAAGLVDSQTLLVGSVPRLGAAKLHRERHVLMLGVGAGSVPGYLSQHLSNTMVTAVDINKDVLFAAQHFFLQGGSENRAQGRHVTLVQGDALTKLKEQVNGSLDAIFMDAYDPHDKAPAGLYTEVGLGIARAKLRDNGRIVIEVNIDSHAGTLDSVTKSLKRLGFNVKHTTSLSSRFVLGVLGDGSSMTSTLSPHTLEEVKTWYASARYQHDVD